jgi:hypothetical protein
MPVGPAEATEKWRLGGKPGQRPPTAAANLLEAFVAKRTTA